MWANDRNWDNAKFYQNDRKRKSVSFYFSYDLDVSN